MSSEHQSRDKSDRDLVNLGRFCVYCISLTGDVTLETPCDAPGRCPDYQPLDPPKPLHFLLPGERAPVFIMLAPRQLKKVGKGRGALFVVETNPPRFVDHVDPIAFMEDPDVERLVLYKYKDEKGGVDEIVVLEKSMVADGAAMVCNGIRALIFCLRATVIDEVHHVEGASS